ncbi:MAG TPA: hypothetical protein VGP58_12145 [Pyrinomonadaceae bacterium]|nr:hypothetical protein [Pyrinomonadaceae bacterium]
MPSRIDDFLRMAMSFGASDLHLRADSLYVFENLIQDLRFRF